MPSFVGRESESARLAGLIREVPVVTVTGPGGVGKTTLAARVAEQIGGEFADGVLWCDLAPIEGGGPVAATVAAALGGRNVALADAEAALPSLVGGRELLIVLDNCEHVTPGAAAAAAGLVASAGARVLATSRESLGLADEHVFALAPLEEADAVALFADRAAAVRTGFALGPDNAEDVTRLCRRLDGLPLAVELAAARARSLSPREIADRLDERFGLLARRKTRAPKRHASLRGAVDWSYELLSADRAAAVRTGFALGPDNADDVARLCQRLDGLPLAVELAAARARSLSPREIADRLDERFGLLARRKTRAPERHASLRGAVDWSYELLSADEQVLFARLGVFSTAVTLAEIEQVCAVESVLDLLDGLVDRSLVTVREGPDGTRYGMLETLREYARERLRERGEVELLHDRHCDRYVAVAESLRVEAITSWDLVGLVRMSDMDDALMALRWCVAHDGAPTRAYAMLAPLWALVHSTAAAEVTDLAERALERWGRVDSRVLGVAAVGHFVLGQPDLARARALEGLAVAGEGRGLIARRALALVVYHYDRELDESDRLLGDVIGLAEQRGATWIAVEMTVLRALVLAAGGHVDAGRALALAARERVRLAGGTHLVAWSSHVLALIELGWGSLDAARRELEEGLELARALDYPLIIGGNLRHLGVVAALEGDRERAAELVLASVDHFRRAGDRVQRWEALRSAAIVLAAFGERETARRLLAGARGSAVARRMAHIERALLDDDEPPASSEDLETLTALATRALGSPSAATGIATFRRDGSIWTLAYAGREVRMPHLKGLTDLATLLANPGREIHCLDLAGDGTGGGDLGEVVDARAREQYRVRAEELQAEIEDARRAHDPVREEQARDELGEIAEALEAAYGLGGRVRRAGDPAERARTTVAWRIRSALSKLEGEHDQLARHLRNAVRTGTWCVYEPEAPVRWEL